MMTLATVCGFAQEATTQPTLSTEKLPAAIEVTLVPPAEKPKNSFFYIRAEVAPIASIGAIPGMGIGYRLISGASALDFSASGKGKSKGGVWTFPKMNYFHYLTPSAEESIYLGGGVALGGITTSNNAFHGMFANATVGYEMHRIERFRSFVQLDINQPAVASRQKGSFPGPSAEFSLGAGF